MTITPIDPVERIASVPAIDVRVDDELQVVAQQMIENDVGTVVVRRASEEAGVISERDLVRSMAEPSEEHDDAVRASDLMTFDPVVVSTDESIERAAALMVEGGIRHLPVARDGKIVGVVSMRDVLRVYSEG